MSNGDTFQIIDDAFNSQGTFIESLSDVGGEIMAVIAENQPYLAAAVAIISLVGTLVQLNQPDPTQTSLAKIQTALTNLFTELNAGGAGVTLLTRNTTLNGYLAGATDALNNLQNSFNDPVRYPPGQYIKACGTTLESLKNNDDYAWNTTYSSQDFEKIYWTDVGLFSNVCKYGSGLTASNDAGYGPRPPKKNGDGVTVFEYRYALPLYLNAVSIFVAVLGTLDPNFPASQSAPLTTASVVLQGKYNQITSGLITLSPWDWTSGGLVQTVCSNPSGSGRPGISLIYDSSNPNVVVGGMMEYGAVEEFSGFSSIGSTYRISLNGNAADSDPALYNKLQLRLLKRTQDVFAAVGLVRVWKTINQLNALVGQPAMPKPTFQWPDGSVFDMTHWSFRQVAGLTKLSPTANGHSFRALGAFIIGTQPFDTPYSPGATTFSFRQLLTNFSD